MKNLNKSERTKYRFKVKLMWLTFLITLWAVIFYLDYGFGNRISNGVLLFISSFLVTAIITSDKYYVTTGYHPNEKEHEDTFKAYYVLHPWEALYSKLTSLLFIGIMIISVLMIISGFFQSS